MDQWLFPVLLSLFTFTAIVGLKYFVWTLPLRRMAKGGYEDALKVARLQRERLREPSSLQARADLQIAQILFRQGYLESALERLRQTASQHLRGRRCGEYFALKALLLMELHRDLEQARWCLENARAYAPRLPCHALYRGHLADLQDQTLAAAEAFQQHLREQERGRFSLADLWVRDRPFRSLPDDRPIPGGSFLG
jgi:hypothetical protein